jgi:hypothetical protein
MKQEDLKPCPFCGKLEPVSVFSDEHLNDGGDPDQYAVVCNAATSTKMVAKKLGCGAQGGFGGTKEKAIKIWNRRVLE